MSASKSVVHLALPPTTNIPNSLKVVKYILANKPKIFNANTSLKVLYLLAGVSYNSPKKYLTRAEKCAIMVVQDEERIPLSGQMDLREELDKANADLTILRDALSRIDDRVQYLQVEAGSIMRILRSADFKEAMKFVTNVPLVPPNSKTVMSFIREEHES